jgi:hypothetical protein
MSGEQTTELPFESTEGEISDIEDQIEVPSDSAKPLTLPVISVTSPTIGLSRPAVVLTSPTALFQTTKMASASTATSTSMEITLPDGSKIRVSNRAKAVNDVAEFVQITSAARVNLTPKEQADVRHAITRKQHSLYNKMDLVSTNLNELVGFQTNLESTERHFGKYDLHQIFMITSTSQEVSLLDPLITSTSQEVSLLDPTITSTSQEVSLLDPLITSTSQEVTLLDSTITSTSQEVTLLDSTTASTTQGVTLLNRSELERVLILAQNLHDCLCADNNWNGVDQIKATFPTFKRPKASSAFLSKCHNCGGEHYLRDCTEPKDQSRIDANQKRTKAAQKLANKNKKGGKGNTNKTIIGHPPGGKFPERPRKGQSNKCTVEGTQFYFHFKSNRWLPVDQQANVVGTTVHTPHQGVTNGGSTPAAHIAERNLIISSISNQFADAMTALSASMAESS